MRWVWLGLGVALVGCEAKRPAPAKAPAKAASSAAPSAAPASTVAPAEPAPATDWPAMIAADESCADCHPDEAEAWAASHMGRSLLRVDGSHPPLAVPASRVHPATNFTYTQREGAFGEESGRHAFKADARFVVGSGAHAHSYLWATDDQLFELPLTWYASKGSWDLSPGYERAEHPGAFRAVTIGCVFCHSNPVPTRPGTKAFFERLPEGPFSCVRCHGDGRAHAEAHLDGRAAPIFNPSTAPDGKGDDTCAFCHFPGAARVVRGERDFGHFVPGRALEDSVAVFVRKEATAGFGSTSHHDRLKLSACAQKTPELRCTTCHALHTKQAERDRSAACRDCHGGAGHAKAHACAGPGGTDCAKCHMDFGQTQNVPHVSATDHFIRAKVETRPPQNNDSPLVWVARPEVSPKDPDHQILLGRAYVETWRADGQPRDAQRAALWLAKGLQQLPRRVDGWVELATLRRLQGNDKGAKAAAERAYALAPENRRVALLTAGARLAAGDPRGALQAIDKAAAAGDSAEVQTLQARILQGLGRLPDARAAAEKATALQPTSSEAWLAAGLLAVQQSSLEVAQKALEAAVDWAPHDVRGWLNLGDVLGRRGQWAAASTAFGQAFGRAGEDADAATIAQLGRLRALVALGRFGEARPLGVALLRAGKPLPGLPTLMAQIHLAAKEYEPAMQAIDAATQFEPKQPETWRVRALVLEARGDVEGASAARARARHLAQPQPQP